GGAEPGPVQQAAAAPRRRSLCRMVFGKAGPLRQVGRQVAFRRAQAWAARLGAVRLEQGSQLRAGPPSGAFGVSRSRESQGVNLRKWLYFTLVRMRGQRLGSYYRQMVKAEREGIPPDTTKRLLVELLEHCKQCVPYYSKLIRELGDGFRDDPEAYLRDFPILTKDIIRSHFDELKSRDLDRRRWFYNTSGGSTGEPVRLIQDR